MTEPGLITVPILTGCHVRLSVVNRAEPLRAVTVALPCLAIWAERSVVHASANSATLQATTLLAQLSLSFIVLLILWDHKISIGQSLGFCRRLSTDYFR